MKKSELKKRILLLEIENGALEREKAEARGEAVKWRAKYRMALLKIDDLENGAEGDEEEEEEKDG